jgi:hypothetical protein
MLDNARNKIQHAVVIMQENRFFDGYFDTVKDDGQAYVTDLIHAPDQCYYVRTRLGQHGNLFNLGRLGWVLRPRRPA